MDLWLTDVVYKMPHYVLVGNDPISVSSDASPALWGLRKPFTYQIIGNYGFPIGVTSPHAPCCHYSMNHPEDIFRLRKRLLLLETCSYISASIFLIPWSPKGVRAGLRRLHYCSNKRWLSTSCFQQRDPHLGLFLETEQSVGDFLLAFQRWLNLTRQKERWHLYRQLVFALCSRQHHSMVLFPAVERLLRLEMFTLPSCAILWQTKETERFLNGLLL